SGRKNRRPARYCFDALQLANPHRDLSAILVIEGSFTGNPGGKIDAQRVIALMPYSLPTRTGIYQPF
ncbi:hypothetical protein QTL91_24620, partial [Salmonella enterica subsp. enterica serovar Typhimurium]|uniref:hypothetical protein n=1 Tax=Salmonella enterica TaxID=28901 RepID=UPI002637224E